MSFTTDKNSRNNNFSSRRNGSNERDYGFSAPKSDKKNDFELNGQTVSDVAIIEKSNNYALGNDSKPEVSTAVADAVLSTGGNTHGIIENRIELEIAHQPLELRNNAKFSTEKQKDSPVSENQTFSSGSENRKISLEINGKPNPPQLNEKPKSFELSNKQLDSVHYENDLSPSKSRQSSFEATGELLPHNVLSKTTLKELQEAAIKENEIAEFQAAAQLAAKKAAAEKAAALDAKKLKIKRFEEKTWLEKRGHTVTFILLYLFTFTLYFRPYELIPGMESFTSLALYLAIATLVVYIPVQFNVDSRLTARPPEFWCIIGMLICGIITIPIARNVGVAWEAFNDTFIKIVLIFIIMINVVRTERRMKALIWLGLIIGVVMSYKSMENFASGELLLEGYRVRAVVNGMFGNPNDMALQFVILTPIAFVLGLATRGWLWRTVYFGMVIMFIVGNMITYSRGGFLGLIAVSVILAWKLSRGQRFKIFGTFLLFTTIAVAVAPGGYGIRILSIFIPGLDPVGSSDQRSELLQRSLFITARNPWGVGMGNFQLMSDSGHVTHNAYTQVSSEMGIVAAACFILLLILPILSLNKIESEMFSREDLFDKERHDYYYYIAIGLQASFIGAMICIFFLSVAYQWFVYYMVIYAISVRQVYQIAREKAEKGGKSFVLKERLLNQGKDLVKARKAKEKLLI